MLGKTVIEKEHEQDILIWRVQVLKVRYDYKSSPAMWTPILNKKEQVIETLEEYL
jgi:hypothetical protein